MGFKNNTYKGNKTMESSYPQEKNLKLALANINENCLRVSLYPSEQKEGLDCFLSEYVAEEINKKAPEYISDIEDGPKAFNIGGFRVKMDTDPLVLNIYDNEENLIQSLEYDAVTGDVLFSVGDEPIYGLGQGFATPMDRRGI